MEAIPKQNGTKRKAAAVATRSSKRYTGERITKEMLHAAAIEVTEKIMQDRGEVKYMKVKPLDPFVQGPDAKRHRVYTMGQIKFTGKNTKGCDKGLVVVKLLPHRKAVDFWFDMYPLALLSKVHDLEERIGRHLVIFVLSDETGMDGEPAIHPERHLYWLKQFAADTDSDSTIEHVIVPYDEVEKYAASKADELSHAVVVSDNEEDDLNEVEGDIDFTAGSETAAVRNAKKQKAAAGANGQAAAPKKQKVTELDGADNDKASASSLGDDSDDSEDEESSHGEDIGSRDSTEEEEEEDEDDDEYDDDDDDEDDDE